MRIAVLGGEGFVGSAFVRLLSRNPEVEITSVTRVSYRDHAGRPFDLVVDAAGNSKKFLADERPVAEFDLSVSHRLRTLHDFPASMQLHISSVDVYSDLSSPATTSEDAAIDPARQSHYGCHKLLAEALVRHYARRWLILRLAGMVGPGLRKNPVYDVLHDVPLHIHPESRYQFMSTDVVAATAWELIAAGREGEVINVCGEGTVTPREIAAMARRGLAVGEPAPASPRVVDVDIDKLKRIRAVPSSRSAIAEFLASQGAAAPAAAGSGARTSREPA